MDWFKKIALVEKLQCLTEEGNLPWQKFENMFMLEIFPDECVSAPFISAKYPIRVFIDPTFLTIVHEGNRIFTVVESNESSSALLKLLYRTARLHTLGLRPIGGEDDYSIEMVANLFVRY